MRIIKGIFGIMCMCLWWFCYKQIKDEKLKWCVASIVFYICGITAMQ